MLTKKTDLNMDSAQALLGKAGQRVLRLYHIYRLIIGLALVLIISSNLENQLLDVVHRQVFLYASWAYLIINIIIGISIQRAERTGILFAIVVLDVAQLCLLYYTAGGQPSGIGNLIIVAVAIANILLYRHLGLLIAAIGAAGIIYLTFYLSLTTPSASNQYMQAGILGMLCFAAALFVQILSKRLKDSEALTQEQASTLADLEALNALVIDRMRTGIIIVDDNYRVVQANQAAQQMLNCRQLQGANLSLHFRALTDSYEAWRQNTSMHPQSVQFSEKTPQLQPSFVRLSTSSQAQQLLFFLEDTRHINQHAQHLKLLSLGRLAAAISHEIRNPLGAISHAAQLLNESEQLDQSDHRLTQIIQDQSRRMNIVIENVLQLSKQHQADPQVLDLKYWLHRFVSNYHENASADHVLRLHVTGKSLRTRMDPHQLDQVLNNLINNAMRFTRVVEGKRYVDLTLYRHPDSQQPILEVLDEGPGIAEAEQHSMFEPFFTTDNKGTGLGLYISRELCEANQARLDYKLRKTIGSCFRVTFAHPKSYGMRQ